MLAKCSTNERHPQPLVKSLSIRKTNQLENLIQSIKSQYYGVQTHWLLLMAVPSSKFLEHTQDRRQEWSQHFLPIIIYCLLVLISSEFFKAAALAFSRGMQRGLVQTMEPYGKDRKLWLYTAEELQAYC